MYISKSIHVQVATVLLAACLLALAAPAMAQTTGFTQDPFTYSLQYPYNLKPSDRFADNAGVYHFWVFNTDKPLRPGNTTRPRTEMRFPDFTKGTHQWEADMMVPASPASDRMCIMQIHTGDAQSPKFGATQFMLDWQSANGGEVRSYSSGQVFATGLAGKWFHVNVIMDAATAVITLYINGKLIYTHTGTKAGDFYFKNGVYDQSGASHETQSYIKNITLWHR